MRIDNADRTTDDLLDALIDRMADTFAQRVLDRLPAAKPANTVLVDSPEMAKRLGISQPTLDRLRAAGTVPCIRIGRRVQYSPDAVIAALQAADHE